MQTLIGKWHLKYYYGTFEVQIPFNRDELDNYTTNEVFISYETEECYYTRRAKVNIIREDINLVSGIVSYENIVLKFQYNLRTKLGWINTNDNEEGYVL